MKLKLFIYLIFIFISISCSNPEKCQELIFEPIDKITTLNGELYTGRCTTYNDGVKRSIQQYVNGVDYGNWLFYHPNGKIETKGKFKNGKRVGTWKYYYSNGKIKQVSKYSKDGERIGNWKNYDSVGNIIKSVRY